MDLFTIIEHNWFTISLLATIITLVYKVIQALSSFEQETKRRDEELKDSLDDFKVEVNDHFEKVDNKFSELDSRRKDEKERTRIIMTGVEATLMSLHNNGYNGAVTESLNEISDYKAHKSAE